MTTHFLKLAAALSGLLLLAGATTLMPRTFRIGDFSTQSPAQTLPTDWEPVEIAKADARTQYDLVRIDSTVVVQATSDGGASGLARRQRLDLTQYPILEWRWKVDGVVEGGNARSKDGDDYPARIFVTFDYDHGFGGTLKRKALQAFGYGSVPSRALNYIWANRVPTGEAIPCPFTDWVQMIPVQSGAEAAGTWVAQRRNVLADYRTVFGEDPPPVTGIVIMTDTDNTGGSATAYYGDIVFRSEDSGRE